MKQSAKYRIISITLIWLVSAALIPLETQPVIYLIGDSTCANKQMDHNPERGWGQLLPNFFTDDVLIENHAVNGRSSKSFRALGHWNIVYAKLKPGDYVFIQFGHNDSKISDTSRYAEAHTGYKSNLLGFIKEIKEKGAVPLLLTPVNRRKFDDNGVFVDQHGDYPAVVREVALETNTPMIDVHKKSLELFSRLGPEKTRELFLHVKPGLFKSLPEGKEDNTHFTRAGAIEIARMVAEGIKELNLPFADKIISEPVFSSREKGKIVALDYYFNCEKKKDPLGAEVQYHYTWEDRENSGFSILANAIENLGAELACVKSAPRFEELKNYRVYVIVDPDTPKETAAPNYITDNDINEIANYVERGGVLLLMGNDFGNCEFDNFNRLAAKFGIRFNEVSINKVTGTKWEMGKISHLPGHPLFKGINNIYLKEISTLALSANAQPVLIDKEDVVMAESKYGKGYVFVVGDPWIYNEYIDHRRLPEEYQNYEAAVNLFVWLLNNGEKVK